MLKKQNKILLHLDMLLHIVGSRLDCSDGLPWPGQQHLVFYGAGRSLLSGSGGSGTRSAAVPELVRNLYRNALARVRSAYALLTTSVGVPMLLAGEEFADIHDTNHYDWQLKMSDPVDWNRREHTGHRQTAAAVSDLFWLRGGHPALQRNEVEFLHFHPTIDDNDGTRVFVYCRTAGTTPGSGGQVVVVANCGGQDFPVYEIPWPWVGGCVERGRAATDAAGWQRSAAGRVALALPAFAVRVFETF